MRILVVIPRFSIGGAEAVVYSLLKAYVEKGFSVYLLEEELVLQKVDSELLDVIHEELGTYAQKSKKRLTIFSRINLFFKGNKKDLLSFDIIHCHLTFGLMLGVMLGWRSRALRKKLVCTIHDVGMSTNLRSFFVNFLAIITFRKVCLVAQTTFWRALQMALPDRLKLYLNGVPSDKSREISFLSGKNHYTRGLAPNTCLKIATICRLERDRDPFRYLNLLETLKGVSPIPVKLMFMGSGSLEKDFKERIILKNLKEDIVLYPGTAEIQEVLRGIDIYVGINVRKNSGVAAFEAISFGLPVVSFQNHRLYKGTTDLIFSSRNYRKLSRQLVKIALDYNYRSDVLISQAKFAEKLLANPVEDKYIELFLDMSANA